MFPTQYQHVIHASRYARWNEKKKRREDYNETMGRYFGFFDSYFKRTIKLSLKDLQDVTPQGSHLWRAARELEAVPSMRALMAAGPMLAREHLTGYNCSYVAIDNIRAFDEVLYLLMCTCGVGFSVERQQIGKLPMVPARLKETLETIVVEDTRESWAKSLNKLLKFLYGGKIPRWDTTKVRPEGSILRTTGGTSSGPEPLERLFRFIVEVFKEARGRRLNSLECHDIVCHIGDIIMVGGVRQAALISLSNLSDMRMRHAKGGNWFQSAPWRSMANNSVAFTEKPTPGAWMAEWLALYDSKSGERGIFNRQAVFDKNAEIGRANFWDADGDEPIEFGTNPCGEINLRPMQLCNLTEAVARAGDDLEELMRKVEVATIFGTWQSALTRFKHVRGKWRTNCEDERLLGVSITGIMDCYILNHLHDGLPGVLQELRRHAREVNQKWAAALGISASKAITCVKPSGTVSQLVDSASGIHPRYAPYYIRRINMNNQHAITKFMKDLGFPWEPSISRKDHISVFEFPIAAPTGAVTRKDRTAIQSLEHWKVFRTHWCDHNPSTTINVSEKEWPAVGGWVYDHFNEIGGLAFMPDLDTSVYKQTPLEEVTYAQFAALDAKMPREVDWRALGAYERQERRPLADRTRNQEFACVAGACELK